MRVEKTTPEVAKTVMGLLTDREYVRASRMIDGVEMNALQIQFKDGSSDVIAVAIGFDINTASIVADQNSPVWVALYAALNSDE